MKLAFNLFLKLNALITYINKPDWYYNLNEKKQSEATYAIK